MSLVIGRIVLSKLDEKGTRKLEMKRELNESIVSSKHL